MNALREAAQLALEALEYGQHSLKQVSEHQWESRGQLAMDALKAALDRQPEPAQEPFGYLWPTGRHPEFRFTQQKRDGVDGTPIYTAPPQRPPLTDEEIGEVYLEWDAVPGRSMADFARAIERKVRGEA